MCYTNRIQKKMAKELLNLKLRYKDINDEVIQEMQILRASGSTMDEVAQHFNIARRTLYQWMDKNEELKKALDEARGIDSEALSLEATKSLGARLQNRMEIIERTEDVWKDSDGNIIKTKETTREKLLQPSDALIMFTLQRLAPSRWDTLAVRRLENGLDEDGEYNKLIDTLLDSYKGKPDKGESNEV